MFIKYTANIELLHEDVEMTESNENAASAGSESHPTRTTDDSENGMFDKH